jgi:flagellar hook assembly protein FlgD
MPNPVRSQTVIRYALPRSGPLTLSVFDVGGRLTRTLVSGVQDAGTHAVVWDGRDQRGVQVANGAYFYNLAAANKVLQRKMLLLR